MVSVLTTIALSALGATATPAPTPAAQPAPTSTAQPDNRKYCLTFEPSTESRIAKRKCLTKAQWADMGIEVEQARK